MQTQIVVAVIFFILEFWGLGVAIYGSNRTNPQLRKPKWRAAGFAMEGAAFLFLCLVSLYFVHNSPRPEVTGYIENLRQWQTKSSGSHFFVADYGGRKFAVYAHYNGPGIQQGQLATVRFMQYNQDLLELTMLSGPTQGWHLTEPYGSTFWFVLGLVGVLFEVTAFREYRRAIARA